MAMLFNDFSVFVQRWRASPSGTKWLGATHLVNSDGFDKWLGVGTRPTSDCGHMRTPMSDVVGNSWTGVHAWWLGRNKGA